MIKTPLSTVIGGAFWTPGATILGSSSQNLTQLIKSIFANNEQGFAYDPNDLTTMWQDQAKLLPVTGTGQPVWHILDKSGNNNHAFATSSATRPILQRNVTTGVYYLAFDGVDDFLVTNSIDFTTTDKVSLFTGLYKPVNQLGTVIELSTDMDSNIGAFKLVSGSANTLNFISKGTVLSSIAKVDAVPCSLAVAAKSDISGQQISISTNKVVSSKTGTQGTGNFGKYPVYIGRRAGASISFNGHIYSLICIGRLTTDSETIALEKAIAKNTGVTL